jgi:hypothetical protein
MKHQTQTAASRPGKQRSAPREPAQQQAGQQAAADAAILRRCRDDAGYFGSREGRWPPFLTDLVDRVRRSWDSSGRAHDTGDAAGPLLRLIDPDILDLLLRIRWQYEPELAAATHPAVREIADVLLTDLAGSQGKGIRPGLQTHLLQEKLAPVFHRLAEQGEQSGSTSLDKAERKDKVESPFKPSLKKQSPEEIPHREPAAAAEVREQIGALDVAIDTLRMQLRGLLDAADPRAEAAKLSRHIETLAAIRAKMQAGYGQLLSPAEAETSECQEELPPGIIAALRTWPAGRRQSAAGGRLENSETFIDRIFAEYYREEGGYDPRKHPRLRAAALKDINLKLYGALTTHNSRYGTTSPYILWKGDEVTQAIEAADRQGYGDLSHREAARLLSAKFRRSRKKASQPTAG